MSGPPAKEDTRKNTAIQYYKYNIKFDNPLKPTHWQHEICNFEEAQKLAIRLNHDPRRLSTIKSIMWDWANYTALGYTFDDLNTTTQFDLRLQQTTLNDKAKIFLEKYVQFQLNL